MPICDSKMEINVFEVLLSRQKMNSAKAYLEERLTWIVATICALLNSNGGNLNLKFEEGQEAGDVLRKIEQRLIGIIGSCLFNDKVKMQRCNFTKELVFLVDSSQSLCTVDYHLYLPTQTQAVPISPWETPDNVKSILNRELCRQQIQVEDFVLNQQVLFTESDFTQFKQLKAESSKCISLADRMTSKSNKLERYISAFANKNGGRIYYGISDEGVVKGEVIEENGRAEIVQKVTNTINKMIWIEGKLERGKHWDIKFVPVKDESMNEILSKFVAIISVEPLLGGLFIHEPESYHCVKKQIKRMSFDVWKRLFFDGEKSSMSTSIVPSFTARTQWSSVKTQKICHKVLEQLVRYQNDGNFLAFKKYASLAEEKFANTDIAFLISAEKIRTAYKKGEFQKAEWQLAKYEKDLLQSETKDHAVHLLRAMHVKSGILRAQGKYEESYNIALEGLQLVESAPAGIITAWFYYYVAILQRHILRQRGGAEKCFWIKKAALDNFIKALQHSQASSVEQEFSATIADLRQRIHVLRAITILGDFVNGKDFRAATPSDIKAAETDLIAYHCMVIDGHIATNYHNICYLFAMSDLRVCQWGQQQNPIVEEESPNLLDEAFDFALEAKNRSTEFQFQELKNYSDKRLAVITQIRNNETSSLLPQ